MNPILPGSKIGVSAVANWGACSPSPPGAWAIGFTPIHPIGIRPTGQIADVEVDAAYEDLDRVREFASGVDVVTFEFENVPAETAAAAAEVARVRPAGDVLHTTQHRLREKTFLERHGFPVTRFAPIRSAEDLSRCVPGFGPAILKTAGFGYDGKGQYGVRSLAEAQAAWKAMDRQEAVLEAVVDFEAELSIVCVRGDSGDCVFYAPSANAHVGGILDVSTAPSPFPAGVAREATQIARGLLEALDVTGVLCVEFFLTREHRLLVNELAPRPHNSGHLTIDACVTSQFEQQLRAVCGLPLGCPRCCFPPPWRTCWAISGVRASQTGYRHFRCRRLNCICTGRPKRGRAQDGASDGYGVDCGAGGTDRSRGEGETVKGSASILCVAAVLVGSIAMPREPLSLQP